MKMYEDQTIYRLRGKETFILVHDAFHSASSWNRVSPILSRLGNKVLSVDLPGHGDDMSSIREQSIYTFAEKVSKLIDIEADKVILVGHGIGGSVITLAAQMRADRVKKLVYAAAWMLEDGQSVSDLSGVDYASLSKDNTVVTPNDYYEKYPPLSLCGERDWLFMMRFAKPEILSVWNEKLLLKEQLKTPRYFVICNRDEVISEDLSEKMINKNECQEIYEINTDHYPNLSMPEELAFVLHDIGLMS